MKSFITILIILSLVPLSATQAQEVAVHDFDSFKAYLNKQNDTTYVINFWATWCIPCVKELPDFEKANEKYQLQKFKMLLVSLDFKSQIESSVIPFIEKKGMASEVVLLSDPNANEWINQVNPSWTGSIPATVIYNKDSYYFHEGSMTFEELDTLISNTIKP